MIYFQGRRSNLIEFCLSQQVPEKEIQHIHPLLFPGLFYYQGMINTYFGGSRGDRSSETEEARQPARALNSAALPASVLRML